MDFRDRHVVITRPPVRLHRRRAVTILLGNQCRRPLAGHLHDRGQANLIFITIIMGRFAAWQTARCSLGLPTTLERS